MVKRTIGIDIGSETIKVVELSHRPTGVEWTRRAVVEHHKEPGERLIQLLGDMDWAGVSSAMVTGRMSRQVKLPRIPIKQAQVAGFRFLFPEEETGTVVSIGSHGFSVLELRPTQLEVFRENSRCSQGTGNFLRQLVERFSLTIEEASEICREVKEPAPLSGRCPVILKTDMTHLANKGEPRERVLAGLYDAVCENVQVLIKPRLSPGTVYLIGGVARSERIRRHFSSFLSRNGMNLFPLSNDERLFFEALGCAVIAAEKEQLVPDLVDVIGPFEDHPLDKLPPLSAYLDRVKRIPPPEESSLGDTPRKIVLGYDIGSTGSKVVALDVETETAVWTAYTNTNGAPVKAAQDLTQKFLDGGVGGWPVVAVGATGSGREIVGSLMSTCFGTDSVYVLNEIAAHAEGALRCDPRVDTIFEIGGQDAKYIRLSQGRVIDAAMNEACSAGTGSFIEEQGRKFSGIDNVVQLAEEACTAEYGVSLGQHCSVFMAEIIDEAVASGVPRNSIIAGIYDSIIQNYLNRVKGSRSVGDVVFCQGMPFSSDALAAAVVRQTGSEVTVPPNPGIVGALGISLLTCKDLDLSDRAPIDMRRFLAAEVLKKDLFVCQSNKGCGGTGNKCRIDRLKTRVDGVEQRFTWGGGCSMYDKGTRKKKLPDLAPDPFREREGLFEKIRVQLSEHRGLKRVSMTDEFALKSLFPFFATYIHGLGFDLVFHTGATQEVLKRGIEDANVPFCAPMQQFHGLVSKMAEERPDYLFLPMIRNIPRVGDERWTKLCPIIQGSPEILRWDIELDGRTEIISPIIDFGKENLASEMFQNSCLKLAEELGASHDLWKAAYLKAVSVQNEFDRECLEIGRQALEFCQKSGVTPIVVLGRTYTIYNTVLNSNVPTLLREQGAIAIPVDCYPVADETPILHSVYWGYGQRSLRAAYQIRSVPKVYSLFCSNYSCGPDSFNIHFYSYLMEGKPFAIIETDGHSGDAGTKTRLEAFLYCVHEDLQNGNGRDKTEFKKTLQGGDESLADIRRRDATVLIPRMGAGADILAACARSIGIKAEALPMPDRKTLSIGRRHTSGKECIPMTLTLGSFLQRIKSTAETGEKISLFMPTANGPCRFGAYNMLNNIVFERLGLGDRVGIWAPVDSGYFDDVPPGFAGMTFAGMVASDMLIGSLYDARPVEIRKGAAQEIYEFYHKELIRLVERVPEKNMTSAATLTEAVSGNLFGISNLLKRAAESFRKVRSDRQIPTVMIAGEIYVRCDPFANDFIVRKLEQRGIRCRFTPFSEWLEYTDYQDGFKTKWSEVVSSFLQATIQNHLYSTAAQVLGWPRRTTVQDALKAARPYIREELSGEAVLTIGSPLHEWREGHIDGVVSVGPLECMPNKLAESQFFHIEEEEGLISLTLHLNGEPTDQELLDNFAYEVHAQFQRRRTGKSIPPPPIRPRPPVWRLSSLVSFRG